MKKTIAITEECNQLLKELAEKNDTTESKIVKWAIEETLHGTSPNIQMRSWRSGVGSSRYRNRIFTC